MVRRGEQVVLVQHLPLATAVLAFLAAVALALTLTLTSTVSTTGLVSAAAATTLSPGGTAAAAAVAATSTTVATAATSVAAATATVSTTTSSVAAAAASATTTAAGAVGGLVNADGASIKFDVVHVLHGVIGLRLLREAHEAESTAAASIAVLDNDSFFDLAELFELLAKSGIVGVPGKATNKELGRHGVNVANNLT